LAFLRLAISAWSSAFFSSFCTCRLCQFMKSSTGPRKRFREMIDSDGGWYNAGRAGLVYNSPKHRGALDRLPFQGFARRSGIQVFRLYSRPSPVKDRTGKWRPMMVPRGY
jgi:hypothetical protein